MSRTSSTLSSGVEPDCESQTQPLKVVADDPEALARIEQTLAPLRPSAFAAAGPQDPCDVAREEAEQRRRIAERLERHLAELAIRVLLKTKGVDDDAA